MRMGYACCVGTLFTQVGAPLSLSQEWVTDLRAANRLDVTNGFGMVFHHSFSKSGLGWIWFFLPATGYPAQPYLKFVFQICYEANQI